MAQYTVLSEEDVQGLGQEFGLSVAGFESFAGGHANSSYLLDTGEGRFVLTVHEQKTRDEVARLARLLRRLGEHGFPTTGVRPTVAGTATALLRGKPVLVKPYVEGEVHSRLQPAMLRQAGSALAHLHSIPAVKGLQERFYGEAFIPTVLGRNLDPSYETWLADRVRSMAERLPSDLPVGLLHGDLFYDNIVFDGSRMRAILDFEEACRYFRVFDLGMAIVGSCHPEGAIDLGGAGALVGGYQEVRELERREVDALQVGTEWAAVTTSCWRYWKFRIETPSQEKADRHSKMSRIADRIAALPADAWTDVTS